MRSVKKFTVEKFVCIVHLVLCIFIQKVLVYLYYAPYIICIYCIILVVAPRIQQSVGEFRCRWSPVVDCDASTSFVDQTALFAHFVRHGHRVTSPRSPLFYPHTLFSPHVFVRGLNYVVPKMKLSHIGSVPNRCQEQYTIR